jgi:release factor glutamine methyltransferase
MNMTVQDAVAAATDALDAAGCADGRFDAELLVAVALGVDRGVVVSDPGRTIPPPVARVVGEWIRRRVQREPVAYILGSQGFRHIELEVDRRVLIPRPDTEVLVEVALELAEGARVHDVGTGSGAVALALKSERPDLRVSGSDQSAEAVEVARANAERLGLDVEMSVADGIPDGEYDLVVANLPYVRNDEYPGLAPEITKWEPRAALVSGEDGLDAIRGLVELAPAGLPVALEHAPDQAAAVRDLLAGGETQRDLAGRERVTTGAVR